MSPYMMKLSGLQNWERAIRKEGQTVDTCSFTREQKQFSAFFDVGVSPYKLLISRHRTAFFFITDVLPGYRIDASAHWQDLRQMLEIPNGNFTEFKPSQFFEYMNEHFPNEYQRGEPPKQAVAHAYNVEDKDKIYLMGHKNWIKHPGSGNRRPKNLEKTRLLYRDIYEETKDYDISICYSANPDKSVESLLSEIKLEL